MGEAVMPMPPKSFTGWPTIQPREPRKARFHLGALDVLKLIVLTLLLYPIMYALEVVTLALVLVVSLLLLLVLLFVYLWLESFLPWNDYYTKLLLMSYRLLFFSRKVPTAKKNMDPALLRPKKKLDKRPLAYALNLYVPHGSEEEFTKENVSFVSTIPVLFEENLYRLPFTDRGGRFAPGEDPAAFLMAQLGDVYPPVRKRYKEKLTDAALTQFCFFGIGAHRLEVEAAADGGRLFVVRTNQLAGLPVRDGLDSYGGDCYFDDSWRVVKIVRARPRRPWEAAGKAAAAAGAAAAGALEETRPGDAGWEHAKFAFRSSLFSLVTLVDHLFGVHMQTGNISAMAAREQLGADHPLRRFLVPFMYQTISVNDNARNNLVNPRSMGPRCFALDDVGTSLAWAAAPSLLRSGVELSGKLPPLEYLGILLDREKYCEHIARELGTSTPYFDQCRAYWRIVKKFVASYLGHYYPTPEAMLADGELVAFVMQSLYDNAAVSGGNSGLATGFDASAVANSPALFQQLCVGLIARFIDVVTAGHEQVGTVPAYTQDASFCSMSWPKGESCGTKQTAINQGVLMAFTSTPMPMLMVTPGGDGDWTGIFLKGADGRVPQPLLDAFATFQSELRVFSAECDAFNEKAEGASFPHCFGLWCWNPKYLETSVSV